MAAFRLHILALACSGLFSGAASAAGPLPALGVDPARISVSGLSSGAFMAVQYGTVYSKEVMGAGIVAGGPYGCSGGTVVGALACMKGTASGAASRNLTLMAQMSGMIEPTDYIRKQRLYLFSGTVDATVAPATMKALGDYYADLGVPAEQISFIQSVPAGHAFISATGEHPCGANEANYINGCVVDGAPYDQPAAILRQIYGPPPAPAREPADAPVAFDQGTYAGPAALMAQNGYAYIPSACRGNGARCGIHIVYHGCLQGAGTVGDAVYGRLGYNRWAAAYRLIMLYPQVDPTPVANPQGCWDWWGYTAPFSYGTKLAPQLRAVRAMVAQLMVKPR